MAKQLILDTTSRFLTVGIVNDGKISEISYECWQRQSEFCMQEIQKLLNKNHLKPKDIEEIIVSKGPGSYTGIRIALAIAKVWTISCNVKVFPISSLQALCDCEKKSIAFLDARANRFFVTMFNKNKCELEDCILEKGELEKLISKHPDYTLEGDVKLIGRDEKPFNLVLKMSKWRQFLEISQDNDKLVPFYLKEAI